MKIAALIALSLFGAGCAASEAQVREPHQQQDAIDPPTPEGVATRITAFDKDMAVTVKVGTRIAVELVGVPTAGYVWKAVTTPDFLKAAGTYGGPTSTAQLQPGFAGGNHWEGFLFEVVAAGEGALNFEQRRAWESDEPAADSFSVTIKAEEQE